MKKATASPCTPGPADSAFCGAMRPGSQGGSQSTQIFPRPWPCRALWRPTGGCEGQPRPESCECAMQVVESVTVNWQPDAWLTLRALAIYSGLSTRTLRAFLTDADHPLPHIRLTRRVVDTKTGKERGASGRILVRASEFDKWVEAFRVESGLDVDRLVDEVVADLEKSPRRSKISVASSPPAHSLSLDSNGRREEVRKA